jgi:hypothetical protein
MKFSLNTQVAGSSETLIINFYTTRHDILAEIYNTKSLYIPLQFHRCVACKHGMARPQVADGGDGLQIWRVGVNVWNKQSRTADKGWSSRLGVGRGANNSSP